jgi:hypothetical protein
MQKLGNQISFHAKQNESSHQKTKQKQKVLCLEKKIVREGWENCTPKICMHQNPIIRGELRKTVINVLAF